MTVQRSDPLPLLPPGPAIPLAEPPERADPPLPGHPPDPDGEAEFWLAPEPASPEADQAAPSPVARLASARSRWLAYAAAVSVVLHGVVLAGLLPRRQDRLTGVPPQLEMELIEEAPQQRGEAAAAPAPAGQQDAAEAAPPPQPAPVEQPDPPQQAAPTAELGQGGVPMPMPYRPPPQQQVPPAPVRQAARPDAPRVNLGAEEDREAYKVESDDVAPPKPDAAFRNAPPRYPQDAGRRGAQGTVQLRVRVTEAGRPLTVVVDRSSGDPSLDRSAMDAVRRWRFTPARRGGVAVPYDYQISIRFVIGNG